MVMPSPFQRLMQQVAKQAEQDPSGAFGRLEELYGKSLTDEDVRNLSGFAAHLGGAGLGRWQETVDFLKRCLEHDGVEEGSECERSVWRALAVIHTCAGQAEAATDAIAAGVRSKAEHCRVCALTAQTLAARRRLDDAQTHLDQALELVADVPGTDEVVTQLGIIANNLARLAEQRLTKARDLLLTASRATLVATERLDDQDNRHRALYGHGRALVLAGRPAEALAVVQNMMDMEHARELDLERFYSAALACRAQIARGQFKIALQALGACQEFAARAEGTEQEQMIQIGKELKSLLADARAAVNNT